MDVNWDSSPQCVSEKPFLPEILKFLKFPKKINFPQKFFLKLIFDMISEEMEVLLDIRRDLYGRYFTKSLIRCTKRSKVARTSYKLTKNVLKKTK
jgi:hypothetical protein